MDTIEDTASDWLDHLRVERGASAHTVSNYRRDIRRYARDLGARGITDIAGVRAADIEAHLASLASGGLTGAPAAPASVARASAAIRGLHAYALRQGRVGADAAAEVRRAGFAVGLHTAGAYPRRLADVLAAELVDWVGLDVKALPDSYPQVVGRQRAGERAWECLRILIDAQAGASARPGTAGGGPPGSQGAPRDVAPGPAGGGRDDQLPGLRVPPGPAGSASEPSGAGATPSDLTFEVRTTVVPGDVTARDAYEVACRVHDAGARVYALQQARGQGTTGDFAVTAAGWDAACERLAGRIEALGWERFTYRPA